MPYRHTQFRDVRVGGGTTVNGKGENVALAAENTDPLPRLQSIAYIRINDGIKRAYAKVRSIN